jgi:hypothetical protein
MVHNSSTRHRLLAVAGPLGAAALAAGSTIGPRLADTVTSDHAEGAKVIAAVAGDRMAVAWAGFFLMSGLLLLIPFFAGVTSLIRGRGATLATVGGTLAMIGAGCGAVSQWFFFSEYQLTASGVSPEAGVAGLTALPGPPAAMLYLTFFGGLTVGWILLVIAAWRSGVFPRAHVAAFGVACVALFVSHSVYSAVIIAGAAVLLAPAIAGRGVTEPAREDVLVG